VPESAHTTPMTMHVAVQSLVAVQGLQAIQPVSTPMVVTPLPAVSAPTPLVPTMKAVTDLDPTMTHSNPIVADDTPTTMDVLEQPTQAVLRLQPVQPMTAPLPLAVFPTIMTSPAPLLMTVVAMTLPDPLMADRNPLRTHVFPPAVSIAVKNSTTVQGS